MAEVDGITGASVGSGRTLEVSMDLADALFDAGYTLHVDAAAEDTPVPPCVSGVAPGHRPRLASS